MVDLLTDIERLESAVICLTEGASDEKRMAIHSLESMIAEKKAVVEKFETEMEKEMGVI
jgi:chaperonin GroEL (HSP60 family)|tara:strand:+ start:3014 stop:3190 length:177 start_codon:yes stop_codon:yes gene_type:complete